VPEPLTVAYADPPYIGRAKAIYGDHPDYAGEVDHIGLVRRLVTEYPDGWALSLSAPTLPTLLNTCHAFGASDVRVGVWVKDWFVMKPGVGVGYAWEPVIWRGGRKRTRKQDTIRDWVRANAVMRSQSRVQTKGQKPETFCFWLFQVLNLKQGDTLVDLFPGSGAVSHSWDRWQHQLWAA
jgi:hypothetical protein